MPAEILNGKLNFCAVIVTVNELIHNQNHEPDFHRTPQWVPQTMGILRSTLRPIIKMV